MKSADVILLSDVILWGEVGNSRYAGPYAIASSLREAGYRVAIIDYFTRFPSQAAFFQYLEGFLTPNLKVIGISSTFLAPSFETLSTRAHRSVGLERFYSGELFASTEDELIQWLDTLRSMLAARAPNAKIVLGGVKAQFAALRPRAYEKVDYVVLGPGDRAIVDITRAIQHKDHPKQKELRGRLVVDNQYDIDNKICPVMRLLPEDSLSRGEAMPLEIARGCIFNCKFCHYEKKQSIKKPLDLLREELIRNYENFGTTTYLFSDDCFNDHPSKVETNCEMFLGLPFKIEWTAYARVDVAVAFPQTVDLMVQSGAKGLFWGIESFDADVARRAGKGTPPDKVKKFLIDFKDRYRGRCMSEGSFIVGLPGESKDSLRRTMDWILETDAFDLITVGPLGLMPFNANLDKVVVDYAEYSRNPGKFGFQKVSFSPNYWEHSEMNSIEAVEIAAEMVSEWKAHKKPGLLRTIWFYPHLKTLGFSPNDIDSICRDEGRIEDWKNEVAKRFESHVQQYHERLASCYRADFVYRDP
jgi:radical SAM superfamily enzyme YgiQ (UPF0313 family)